MTWYISICFLTWTIGKYVFPEEIQVIAFYDSPVQESHSPPIAALLVDVRMLSFMAENLVVNILQKKKT